MGVLPDSGPVAERLDREAIGWLTTVTADGQPQSSPVWFLLHEGAIYVQSQPGAAKVKNIGADRKVSLHLNSDEAGGNVVTIDADAEIFDGIPAGLRDPYMTKYERRIREELESTPDAVAVEYSTTLRLVPRRARIW